MAQDVHISYLLSGSAVIILTSALLRLLPFLIFRKRATPRWIERSGQWLPPAMLALLVVYCYKDVAYADGISFLPALLAGVSVVVLHLWKRQSLLSIFGGTLIYMILIQYVFV